MSKLGVCGGLLIREAWFESTMGSHCSGEVAFASMSHKVPQ